MACGSVIGTVISGVSTSSSSKQSEREVDVETCACLDGCSHASSVRLDGLQSSRWQRLPDGLDLERKLGVSVPSFWSVIGDCGDAGGFPGKDLADRYRIGRRRHGLVVGLRVDAGSRNGPIAGGQEGLDCSRLVGSRATHADGT